MYIAVVLGLVVGLAAGYLARSFTWNRKEEIVEEYDPFRDDTTANINNIFTTIKKSGNRIDSIVAYMDTIKLYMAALEESDTALTERMDTFMMIAEELAKEIIEVKDEHKTSVDRIVEIEEAVNSLLDSNEVMGQAFNATLANVTSLQENQQATEALLNETIDGIEWADDDTPGVRPENPLVRAFVPDVHGPVDANGDPKYEEPELVPVRGDNDPLITDLRATPFEEYTGPALPDPYSLHGVDGVEEWGSSSSSTSTPESRSQARARNHARFMGGR